MTADALIMTRMKLSPKGAQPIMRDGKPKGIKQVFKEYNFWPDKGICLICKQCSGKQDDVDPEKSDCCARRIMSLQHDFCEQKSILEEEQIIYLNNTQSSIVLEVLTSIPVITIRKFAQKLWKYMNAYNKGLEGRVTNGLLININPIVIYLKILKE
ncbi:hypothetical protein RhiirA4_470636 [Rhizophagus irregularis]|uniref:Uncharacterized protein n=1 Tax=Rhizophagus irregularis TaxID=588596 RepID=A0A2I1H1L4_9GLOM|nr:hypothetical protein RhiirA4_470636 [Rhizophagus irregularis]